MMNIDSGLNSEEKKPKLNRTKQWALENGVPTSVNFIISSQNYSIEGYIFDYNRIVVTFEPDMNDYPQTEFRVGWGSTALRKKLVSHLCIKRNAGDWFQAPDFVELLTKLRPLLKKFGTRVTYGASMGGFAALAFADLIGADQAFVFDPQSTLHRPSVPFEKRFLKAYTLDFTGKFGSAVGKFNRCKQVFILLDKFCKEDVAHAKLLETPVTQMINVPFVGHGAAYAVAAAGCMPIVFNGVVTGTFDTSLFYRQLHLGRRKVDRYKAGIETRVKDRPALQSVATRFLGAKP